MTLTEEEKKEAAQLQMEERLRRQNPPAYDSLIAKQRADQSESIGRFLANKPVGDASQALIDFQSRRANQPEDSVLPTKDSPAKFELVTPKFRPHPTYHPSVHPPNTISLPSRGPTHLMPIPGSGTQVQSTDPNPPTIMTNVGQDDPPTQMTTTTINTGGDESKPGTPDTLPSGPTLPTFKAKPRFEHLLAGEAKKMAQEKKA